MFFDEEIDTTADKDIQIGEKNIAVDHQKLKKVLSSPSRVKISFWFGSENLWIERVLVGTDPRNSAMYVIIFNKIELIKKRFVIVCIDDFDKR